MDIDIRTWLIHFDWKDLPSMSAAEILHRIVALREIEDAPHYNFRTSFGKEHRDTVARIIREELNGHGGYHIYLLQEELKRRGLLDPAYSSKGPERLGTN